MSKTDKLPKDSYLGNLCKRKHNYENTGKSLRYKSGVCVACNRENLRQVYANIKEDPIKLQKHKQYCRKYMRKYRQEKALASL